MQGKKILIAEASSTIKSVADSLLRQHGYDVVCTSDGLQAWEVIQAERPELALIGLNLSGVPGLELCKQMSGDQIARGIPSLLIIGAGDNLSKEELIKSGARGYLKKPFSPKDLLEAVTRLVGPGKESEAQQVNGGHNTTKTTYKAEVYSTTGNIKNDSDQIHNINWSDINETSDVPQPRKVASVNASSDEHELLIEASKNSKLSEIMKGFSLQIKSIETGYLDVYERGEKTVKEHLTILDALAKGDSKLAKKLIREHLRDAEEHLLVSLKTQNQISGDS